MGPNKTMKNPILEAHKFQIIVHIKTRKMTGTMQEAQNYMAQTYFLFEISPRINDLIILRVLLAMIELKEPMHFA